MAWKKLNSRQEKVGYKYVIHKNFMLPDGSEIEYTTWGKEGDGNVAVIAITGDNQVVISHQYRPGPEAMYDEIPGGGVEPGEQLEDAARRELREETGYEPDEIKKIGTVFRDSYMNEPSNYFLATGCKRIHEQELDEDEHIEVGLISIQELITNAKQGRMSDGIAVLLAYDELMKIMEKQND